MDQREEIFNIMLTEFPDIDQEMLQALFSAYEQKLFPALAHVIEKIGKVPVALSLVLIAGLLIKEELDEISTDFDELFVSMRDEVGKKNGNAAGS